MLDQPHVLLGVLSSVAETPTGAHHVAAATSFVLPEHKGEEPNIIHEN